MTDEAADTPAPDVARLTAEAATKSGLLWIRVPGGATHPVWHVWRPADEGRGTPAAVLVVSGPGEQHLPWLPEHVELVLRSKDTGGRLLVVPATASEVVPGSLGWDAAVDLLRPARLNATGDLAARWHDTATIHVLVPATEAVEGPGGFDDSAGSAPVRPAAPATARWRPWHWRGRAGTRRSATR